MRDPERIRKIAPALILLWMDYPDMRLGQLVMNLGRDGDLWNLEDDEMLERIQLARGGVWPKVEA